MPDDQNKDDEDGIYRLDTVPPPMGESDAYSAPTKVGPMAAAAVEELMKAAEQRASELSARAAEKRKVAAASAKSPSGSPPSGPWSARPAGEPAVASERNDARASAPPSKRTGPSGRPASAIGGSPASVPAQPASAAKPARRPAPPQVPKPAAAPSTPMPAAQTVPASPKAVPAPPQDAQSSSVPRLYESLDAEFDDEYAETQLHKNAQPPVVSAAPMPPMRSQLHTQPMDAALASSVVQAVDRRASAAPQRVSAAQVATASVHQAPAPAVRAPEPMKVWLPLVVGMITFVIGLTCFLLAR